MKAAAAAPKTWFPTRYPHLYRHKSGVYYARLFIGGNKTWRSLKTEVLSVARVELGRLNQEADHQKEVSQSGDLSEHLTGGQAIQLRRKQIENDASMKKGTRKYWNDVLDSLLRSWPGFAELELRKVTVEDCESWAGKNRPAMSSTRFNNGVSALRTLFQIAVKKGARLTNPAGEVKRAKVKTKDLSSRLPTKAQFTALIAEMRRPNARFSNACADLVELFAYTGMRKGEVARFEWQDCNFAKTTLRIKGDPEEGTKNGEIRFVPMIPACEQFLKRLRAERP